MNGSTNTKRIKWAGLALVLLATFGLGYYASRARAAGIPQMAPLVYSGVLTDGAGAPMTGSKNVLLQIFNVASAGTALCQSMPTTVNLAGGAFRVPLGDDCTAIVHANPDLWIDVLIDGASIGRAKMGAVPYAIEADTAQRAATAAAGGALATQIAALTTRVSTLETGLAAVPKTIAGRQILTSGTCSVTTPCLIDISRGAFRAVPTCTVSMGNIDGTGYSELMVIRGVSTTALAIWKGQFYTSGTTMDVYYICTGA